MMYRSIAMNGGKERNQLKKKNIYVTHIETVGQHANQKKGDGKLFQSFDISRKHTITVCAAAMYNGEWLTCKNTISVINTTKKQPK